MPQGIKTIDGVDSSIIRQVYSQHYTDWSLGTILTLFQLSLLSGMSWLHTALLLIATEGQIQTASIAALQGDHTYGYTTFHQYPADCISPVERWSGGGSLYCLQPTAYTMCPCMEEKVRLKSSARRIHVRSDDGFSCSSTTYPSLHIV